jgi:hypothetical protein
MRLFVIKQESDLQALSATLLAANASATRADAAMASLQALNPHVDIARLKPGTVLLVPNEPGFKPSASDSVPAATLDDFRSLVQASLGDAAKRLRSATAARSDDRSAVAAALKSAVVKKATDGDADLAAQLAEASRTLKTDQDADEQAQLALDTSTKAALAELAALGKLLG